MEGDKRMDIKQSRIFTTSDLYLAAVIVVLLKIEPDFDVVNGRTLAVFPVCDELYQAMTAYNSGTEVPAFEYAETIKRIRAEFITRRKEVTT